jgi:hypothetical protein
MGTASRLFDGYIFDGYIFDGYIFDGYIFDGYIFDGYIGQAESVVRRWVIPRQFAVGRLHDTGGAALL